MASPPQGSCLLQGDSDPCETKPQVIVLAAGLENKCNPGEKVKVESAEEKWPKLLKAPFSLEGWGRGKQGCG